MNRLLPYAIKDTPEAIFNVVGQAVIERHILESVMTAGNMQMPMEQSVRRRLAHRPRLIADLIAADFLTAADRDTMVTTSTEAINVVSHNISLLPIWRNLILSDPETTEQLFYLCGMQDEPVTSVTNEEMLSVVQDDPARLLRMSSSCPEDEFVSLNTDILEALPSRMHSSPEWAMEWVARTMIPDDRPLADNLVAAIEKSEEACYLAMRILRRRGCAPLVWEPLEKAIKTPRWAYHALRDDLLMKDESRCEDIIVTHPGWLVEWLTAAKFDAATNRELYLRCSRAAFDHELIGDLHHWFKAQTFMRLAQRGHPVAS